MNAIQGFQYKVRVKSDRLNVSVIDETSGMEMFFTPEIAKQADVKATRDQIWNSSWISLEHRLEIDKAISRAVVDAKRKPIHVQRDQMDFAEGNREAMSWLERVLLLGIWLYVLVLTWIVSKTDVGASWGW